MLADLSLETGKGFSHLGGAQSRGAAPPHCKEPAEVVQPSDLDASWACPVPGLSFWEDAPGQTQDMPKRLHFLAGRETEGMPLCSPGCCTGDLDTYKWQKMHEWVLLFY